MSDNLQNLADRYAVAESTARNTPALRDLVLQQQAAKRARLEDPYAQWPTEEEPRRSAVLPRLTEEGIVAPHLWKEIEQGFSAPRRSTEGWTPEQMVDEATNLVTNIEVGGALTPARVLPSKNIIGTITPTGSTYGEKKGAELIAAAKAPALSKDVPVSKTDPIIQGGDYEFLESTTPLGWHVYPVKRGEKIPVFRNAEEAQAAIDDFTEQLIAKHGEEDVFNFPVATHTGGFANLDIPATKMTAEEISKLRRMYYARDSFEQKEMQAAQSTIKSRIADVDPEAAETVGSLFDELLRRKTLDEAFGRMPAVSEDEYRRTVSDVYRRLAQKEWPRADVLHDIDNAERLWHSGAAGVDPTHIVDKAKAIVNSILRTEPETKALPLRKAEGGPVTAPNAADYIVEAVSGMPERTFGGMAVIGQYIFDRLTPEQQRALKRAEAAGGDMLDKLLRHAAESPEGQSIRLLAGEAFRATEPIRQQYAQATAKREAMGVQAPGMTDNPLFDWADPAHAGLPGFFSRLERGVAAAPEKALTTGLSAQQWLNANMGRYGIKQSEIEATGLGKYLDELGTGKTSKTEMLERVKAGEPDLIETRFSERTPSDEEIDVFLADEAGQGYTREEAFDYLASDNELPAAFTVHTIPRGENHREFTFTLSDAKNQPQYRVPREHQYGAPEADANRVVHFRVNDRVGPNGEKQLFVEEIQSDWGQAFRKGPWEAYNQSTRTLLGEFKTKELAQEAIEQQRNMQKGMFPELEPSTYSIKNAGAPSAPYVTDTKDWTELAIKRIMQDAVENGYDQVVFINGAQSAEKYSLSKQVSKVEYKYNKAFPNDGALFAYDLNGNKVLEEKGIRREKLPDYIGEEATQKLLKAERNAGDNTAISELSGLDLQVGGEGMKGYYDEIIPQVARKLTKQYGGRSGFMQHDPYRIFTPGDFEAYLNHEGLYRREGDSRLWRKDEHGNWYEPTFGAEDQIRQGFNRNEEKMFERRMKAPELPDRLGTQFTIDVTPEMKKSVTEKGFSSFAEGGLVATKKKYTLT